MEKSIYKQFQLTYNDYTRNYDHYLLEFLNDYEDNTELFYIKEQKILLDNNLAKLKEVIKNLKEEDENKEELLDLFRNRINTTDRIKSFLEQRKQELENELNTTLSRVPATENLLDWIGSQTEFIELIKALIENGNIKGTQTEIISKLSKVFNIDIKHPNKLITDIKKRNNGSETLFLDKLQKSLLDYITQEKKK